VAELKPLRGRRLGCAQAGEATNGEERNQPLRSSRQESWSSEGDRELVEQRSGEEARCLAGDPQGVTLALPSRMISGTPFERQFLF
jgi:hypothetical protein